MSGLRVFTLTIIVSVSMISSVGANEVTAPDKLRAHENAQGYDWSRFHGPGTPGEQRSSIEWCSSRVSIPADSLNPFIEVFAGEEHSPEEQLILLSERFELDPGCVFLLHSKGPEMFLVIRANEADYAFMYGHIRTSQDIDGIEQEEFMTRDYEHLLTWFHDKSE